MMYKIGDIITTRTYNGTYHLNIIENILEKDDVTCLCCNRLYDGLLNSDRFNNTEFSILLPEQKDSILPKEEYFKAMQDKINEQQEKLNSIKEKYNV